MKIISQIYSFICYCLRSIKQGLITLFLIVKRDIEQLGVHLFNGGNALKSKDALN